MDGLAVIGFVFGLVGVIGLVRLEKLTKKSSALFQNTQSQSNNS